MKRTLLAVFLATVLNSAMCFSQTRHAGMLELPNTWTAEQTVITVNGVQFASQFPGSDAGAKIAAAIAAAPSIKQEIVVDLYGIQTVSQNVWNGVTKVGILRFVGGSDITFTATQKVPSGWTIVGAGRGITRLIDGTVGMDVFEVDDKTDITFSSFTYIGTGSTTPSSTDTEFPIYIHSATQAELNVTVEDVDISSAPQMVYIYNAAKVKVINNYFHDGVGDIPADSEGYGVLMARAKGVLVLNNHFNRIPRHAIYFGDGTVDSIAQANVINDNTMTAINVQQTGDANPWTEDILINNNIIDTVPGTAAADNGYCIAILRKSRRVKAIGNICVLPDDGGVLVSGDDTDANIPSDVTVENNSLYMEGGSVGFKSVRASGVIFRGNQALGDGTGLVGFQVSGSGTHTAVECELVGNRADNWATYSYNIESTASATRMTNNTSSISAVAFNDSGTGTIQTNIGPDPNYASDYSWFSQRTWEDPTKPVWQAHSHAVALSTSSANNFGVVGFLGDARLDSSNTQNWTSPTGLVGVLGIGDTGTGSTGTVTNHSGIGGSIIHAGSGTINTAAAVRAFPKTGSGTVTNLYSFLADAGSGVAYFGNDGIKVPVTATGSLPAAAAAMDGQIVIEDAGSGDRNLIIYAGGQRFRIDGGTAF